MVGIMFLCMYGFVFRVLEGRYLGSFVGSFDGTGYYVIGPYVGLGLEGIMTASEIDAMQLNESSPVYCRSEI